MTELLMEIHPVAAYFSMISALILYLCVIGHGRKGERYTIQSTVYASGEEEHTILEWGGVLYEYADHSYSCSVTFSNKAAAERWIKSRTVVSC